MSPYWVSNEVEWTFLIPMKSKKDRFLSIHMKGLNRTEMNWPEFCFEKERSPLTPLPRNHERRLLPQQSLC